jgi:hypothetical protein
MLFRIFGSVDSIPAMDDLIECLEEGEFEVTFESEDEDEENWSEIQIYEASLDGPVVLFRMVDGDALGEELSDAIDALTEDESEEALNVRGALESASIGYGIDLPDDLTEDDNALVLCQVLAQFMAQRCDGIYSVDGEAWFNEAGELILEYASEE